MHLGPLCMQLRTPISFFLLFGASSSPGKVQHFLVSPNSIKIVPNGMFFGAATGSGLPLCWGRCTKTRTFLRDPHHPSQKRNSHLIDKIADFLRNKRFFLIARGICIIIGPVRSLAHPCKVNNTFFRLSEGQKWGFFPKDRTHRAFLHNNFFFLIAARDLHYYWASAQPCAALRS